MASSTLRCEIRQLMVHIDPGGHKAPDAGRFMVFYGRRGRPVKKARFIPAERVHFWARRLQARRLGTVSVLSAAGFLVMPAAGSPAAGVSVRMGMSNTGFPKQPTSVKCK